MVQKKKTNSRKKRKGATAAATEARVQGRRQLKAMRERLGSMNGVQLRAFFGGFPVARIDAFEKAIVRIRDEQKTQLIKAKQAQIAALQKEIDGMS
jgi:hypothetical protein